MATKTFFQKIARKGAAALKRTAKEWLAVFDKRTGLTWTKDDWRVNNYAECAEVIKRLNKEKHGGYSDWRLPTVEELFCLADRSRIKPAIDTAFFPDCKNDWYWTATPDAESPSVYAWSVNFDYGYSSRNLHNYYGFVRAVRGGQ